MNLCDFSAAERLMHDAKYEGRSYRYKGFSFVGAMLELYTQTYK